MDKDILSVEKTLYSIKTSLLSNENIRRLLYYDTPDALEQVAVPSVNDTSGYIFIKPIMQYAIEPPYNKNQFIMITLPTIDLDTEEDDSIFPGIFITVGGILENLELNNNRLRLLRMANEIINMVDNKKFNLSNKLYVIKLEEVIFDEKVSGYIIKVFSSHNGKEVDF